ncbi:UPF0149 family protein [Duganella violaceipulchra]|uniref:UPF0149 family protein n=1 Tax=Duganella violaceipulchra TaxID=2849652 RepID=A0AA41H4J2_9BURK|nr:UPF0149 family protein [Duganella violaceicalia]MBV6319544.1 UPF0149 family protein [Duganella violaceicalia]MCP2006644.1 uncharacterized protein [Duganella violaceicalia]
MPHTEPELIDSPLSQTIVRDGKPIRLDICNDADGGWLLEAVDQHGNSTVWKESFPTEQDALDEGLRTINDEGIDVLIGPPDPDGKMPPAFAARIENEFSLLEDFLNDACTTGPVMDMQTMEGFMTAAIIGPRLMLPSEWLPWIWDRVDGGADAPFDNQEQAEKVLDQLMRKYNRLIDAFESGAFAPALGNDEQEGAQRWCHGFLDAAKLNGPAWSLLMMAHPAWFAPLARLGTVDGADITEQQGDARKQIDAITPSLVNIRSYWRLHAADIDQHVGITLVRAAPKVGRNDPCPCGSGKKHKRCCGAGAASVTPA